MDRHAQGTTPTGGNPGRRGAESIGLWKGDCNEAGITDSTPSASNNQLLRPRAGTVADSFLTALEKGRHLTSEDARRSCGSSRAAAVAHDLKRRGWPIKTVMVSVECADGRTAHVACYSMGRAE